MDTRKTSGVYEIGACSQLIDTIIGSIANTIGNGLWDDLKRQRILTLDSWSFCTHSDDCWSISHCPDWIVEVRLVWLYSQSPKQLGFSDLLFIFEFTEWWWCHCQICNVDAYTWNLAQPKTRIHRGWRNWREDDDAALIKFFWKLKCCHSDSPQCFPPVKSGPSTPFTLWRSWTDWIDCTKLRTWSRCRSWNVRTSFQNLLGWNLYIVTSSYQ